MCDKAVSEDPFLLVYCPDKYITQKICDEAVANSKTLFTALYVDENIYTLL